MKRALIIIFSILIIMQFFTIEKVNAKVDEKLELNAPSEVKEILVRACYDCHSQKTSWPWYSNIAPMSWTIASHVEDGREWVDFSIWNSYTKEEQQKKLKEIFRAVYAAMPIGSYVYFHDEAKLTQEERKIVRDWTGVRK